MVGSHRVEWEDLGFLNPLAGIVLSENRLPHWQQSGVVYFVTFRLSDSLPVHLLKRWGSEREVWLASNPPPWSAATEADYRQRFTAKIEGWLDAGYGRCVLMDQANAEIVSEALLYFDGVRGRLVSFVVMPNHVHVLWQQSGEWTLERILHSWRRHSVRRINARMQTAGALWQRDYFDRIVRNREHLSRCVRYIRNNPVKVALPSGTFLHYENDLACRIE